MSITPPAEPDSGRDRGEQATPSGGQPAAAAGEEPADGLDGSSTVEEPPEGYQPL
jgi:hypothetical protein